MRGRSWLRRLLHTRADQPLQGGLDVLMPSMLAGWVFHPDFPLSEVRLLRGNALIAMAPIHVHRSDVCTRIGKSGDFGFILEIPDHRPDHVQGEPLRLLAITADGSARFPIKLMRANEAETLRRLELALTPEFRGLRGHFDGQSADGAELRGWCYSRPLGQARIWLHAEGLPPRAIACNEYRAGMASQGHPENCGFVMPLYKWPEVAGRLVWASFDEAGELRLPPSAPVRISQPNAIPRNQPLPAVAITEEGGTDSPEVVVDYQEHWQALEEFRNLIDHLELQVEQAEALAFKEAKAQRPPSRMPEIKRSARFKLWR